MRRESIAQVPILNSSSDGISSLTQKYLGQRKSFVVVRAGLHFSIW